MKREQAVLIIAESLVEPRHDDVMKEASHILKRLEKAGMMPPCHPDLFCFDCDDGSPMCKWEDEDET